MEINDELIKKLSDLAKLELNENNKNEIAQDLERMISFVSKLSELNVDNVEPLIYLSEEINQTRLDIEKEALKKSDALKNAPDSDSDYFKVPKVLDK
jgi:aspartyl-tRNA(Asn)/glutamyl-tRNA(Gln) amidotransferase subunit C